MDKSVRSSFVNIDGEPFYKIENYDKMEDFFMTITSSSDIWNFCWSHGGITAGRVNSNHAVFPYATADKVSDSKTVTGPYTVIAVKHDGDVSFWEPFANMLSKDSRRFLDNKDIHRSIYKNANGTKVIFEEINDTFALLFRQGWTSSEKFGLVRTVSVENLSPHSVSISVLDGCRNIMSEGATADFQNNNSVLLDAYKKTDFDTDAALALFAYSSIVTDKAEPSECLLANVGWFSCAGKHFVSEQAVQNFFESNGNVAAMTEVTVLKGERPSFYIARELGLQPQGREQSVQGWYQVFDTALTASRIVALKKQLADRSKITAGLVQDIAFGDERMTRYISEADGIQNTADAMVDLHHRANVMFNIMRGGFFADEGRINISDFLAFVKTWNKQEYAVAKELFCSHSMETQISVEKDAVRSVIESANDRQLSRLFLEYLPVIFSRRHGDPSRPWNRFNIKLSGKDGQPILNYEGNWRDIFQNWEATVCSYPEYIKNITAKFLNAMTVDGYNPYRISKEGIDWEVPDPTNPWAQYGYWGDHQVIYLQKLLELWNKFDSDGLCSSLNERLYASSNVPYRIKTYAEILENPRNSILFDAALSKNLLAQAQEYGSDKKLVQGEDGNPYLLTLAAKLLQVILTKAANLIPGGGIWMNTQRPEWNDANNALAGWGISVVTLCYLHRMLNFVHELFSASDEELFSLPKRQAECLEQLSALYADANLQKASCDDAARFDFVQKAELIFEAERNALYREGYSGGESTVKKNPILAFIDKLKSYTAYCIQLNKRSDGLYHSYNTLSVYGKQMSVTRLQEMLEGQVAVLSAAVLSPSEAVALCKALKASALYEKRQNSYMLYPNKVLCDFTHKNCVSAERLSSLQTLLSRSGNKILEQDADGVFHFNPLFKNSRLMQEFVAQLSGGERPSPSELKELLVIYEETFLHQNFTGRSGTFFAYEGLGSIYWHMVSKLLLAVQENALAAYASADPAAQELTAVYYDVRGGLGFNKSPELYGAFPSDPYSHTPSGKGAKQPGMTGQVKEEILTRWGELGVSVKDGCLSFAPVILHQEEYSAAGTLSFSYCGITVMYTKAKEKSVTVQYADGRSATFAGNTLGREESRLLFSRGGKISSVTVAV